MATATDNIEEDFINVINSIETCPVTAFIEDIADREEGEEYAGIRIILVAKEPGEDGNEITLGYVSEPNLNDGTFSNGDTLEGGKDERTIVDIMPGTVYLPSNVIANIPKKEGLEVKSDEVDYIILTLKRSAHGTISYKYSVAKETLGENYIIVEPLEEIDEEATQEQQN